MKRRKRNQRILLFLFICYMLLMGWLLFGQRTHKNVGVDNLNIKPFTTLKLYANILKYNSDGYLLRHAFINLVGNVIMFIPLGFFLSSFFKQTKSFWGMLLVAGVLIVLIETVQYITGLGSCDIDDLILNVPGIMIGWCIRWVISKKHK